MKEVGHRGHVTAVDLVVASFSNHFLCFLAPFSTSFLCLLAFKKRKDPVTTFYPRTRG